MGNCVFQGMSSELKEPETIKVMTINGGVMELTPPVTAEHITNSFPNHAIFRNSHPLLHTEELHSNEPYFLLPTKSIKTNKDENEDAVNKPRHCPTPYRMSLERGGKGGGYHRKQGSGGGGAGNGVWKVKLVIGREQLAEILKREEMTEELVESLRTVAKYGGGGGANGGGSVCGGSDQWEFSGNVSASDRSN